MRKAITAVAASLVLVLTAQAAWAEFTPVFEVALSDTKVLGNPELSFHLEFDENDDEIGNFTGGIPKGFNIAPDEAIANDEMIGGGDITIRAGFDCRPGPEGAIPVGTPVTVDAEFFERDRTDAEVDSGVHSVWFLDLEPLNRVRLLVTGSKKTGWTVSGAPTPSDNTCNPLIVDLKINSKSESGVPIVTNPKKAGKKLFTADISNQDTSAIAHFEQVIKITK